MPSPLRVFKLKNTHLSNWKNGMKMLKNVIELHLGDVTIDPNELYSFIQQRPRFETIILKGTGYEDVNGLINLLGDSCGDQITEFYYSYKVICDSG